MKRRWKVVIGLLFALAILLGVNALITSSQTKEAEVTVDGGRILNLSRGDVQVTDTGEPSSGRGQPIVLLHCYTCSLRWFERIEPILAANHRVIRIDLLGHGGSEKPETGYDIPTQAATVAEALNELGVEGALVAGNSMGAMVTASLAEQASQLVDRAVVIDMAPNTEDFGDGRPVTARLGHAPVLGQALWRVTPDFVISDESDISFAPGFDVADGFDDPETPVEDVRAMTYPSFDEASEEAEACAEEAPLDQRFTAATVPLLVIFGAEDQIFDADEAIDGYADVPGVRTEIVDGAGHAPQVEKPDEVAALLEEFSVDLPAAAEEKRGDARAKRGERRRKGDRSKGDRGGGERGGKPNRKGNRD